MPPRQGALWAVLAAAVVWAALSLGALAAPAGVRLRFLAHLAMVTAAGAVVLLPAALFAPLLDGALLWLLVTLALAASLAVMARQLARRLRYLSLWPRQRPA